MDLWRRIGRKRWVQVSIGTLAAEYLRLVARTSSFVLEPHDAYERMAPRLPFIIAMWHGQHFLSAFGARPEYKAKVLISRHRDGEINAIAAERLGIGTIRGSGAHDTNFHHKRGVAAFMEMVDALEQGYNMALTADVPKVARVAGRGIVLLARASGRPIVPLAVATSRRIVIDNWDRTTINLPFSRSAAVVGEPIEVPADADDAMMEQCRLRLETDLNAATARAYEIVDGGKGGERRA